MPPRVVTTIGSTELGLPVGNLTALDKLVCRFPREQIILRSLTILHALNADRDTYYQQLNREFLAACKKVPDVAERLAAALSKENATIVEPWQQLVILRRAFTVGPVEGPLSFEQEEGFRAYFDCLRFAGDITLAEAHKEPGEERIDAWLKVAASFMSRLWLITPVNPNVAIGRLELMLETLPSLDPSLTEYVEALRARFPETIGATFDEASLIIQFLSYWSLALDLKGIFAEGGPPRLNPDTWVAQTDVARNVLETVLANIAWNWTETLSDDSLGGALSTLPFRVRPLIKFQDDTYAPVMRELVLEKLTSDIFWWVKEDPAAPQSNMWQASWGHIAEAYFAWVLRRMAENTGCGFASNITWKTIDGHDAQLDAAMWFKGHVALFEVSAGALTDAAGNLGDWEELKKGLHRKFVQAPGKKGKR